jgi:hypothetical protein
MLDLRDHRPDTERTVMFDYSIVVVGPMAELTLWLVKILDSMGQKVIFIAPEGKVDVWTEILVKVKRHNSDSAKIHSKLMRIAITVMRYAEKSSISHLGDAAMANYVGAIKA